MPEEGPDVGSIEGLWCGSGNRGTELGSWSEVQDASPAAAGGSTERVKARVAGTSMGRASVDLMEAPAQLWMEAVVVVAHR